MYSTTPLERIVSAVESARRAFDADVTRSMRWRRRTLEHLQLSLRRRETELLDALAADFAKPAIEAWVTEIGFTIADIDHTLANLPSWAAPRRVHTPVVAQPGSSHVVQQPKGVVAIIAPWNYPVQLCLVPLVAAIAAGNAAVVKPSELTPATADVLARVIADLDDPAIGIVLGGVTETTELLAQRFDHILYTGNSRVARIVMRAAAEHLTPVTLELGGKSPAIVSRRANIDVAARRIAWGKFVNAGQTCIAPDYVLIDSTVHDAFVTALGNHIRSFYGEHPERSADYARIVNQPQFHRLEKLLDSGTVAVGGTADADTRYIAPTVLTDVSESDPVMQEEIFGPILPVIAVDTLDAAIEFVQRRVRDGDKPLALYTFSEDDAENDRVLDATTSGGACVNATLFHVSNPHLPFGGIGESGMGAYHGRFGFDTFSHQRAVLRRGTRLDPSVVYPPYTSAKQRVLRRGTAISDPRDVIARVRNRLRR
jgi:aldehyde dehydrogenase (NAD+)